MQFNVCVNKMAPFGPFAAFIEACITFDSSDKNGGQRTRRDDSNPQGMKVFAVERHDFLKISCLSKLCVVCNRRHS